MTDDPIGQARQIAFSILTKHPDCLRDDVSLSNLIDDIAAAIAVPLKAREALAAAQPYIAKRADSFGSDWAAAELLDKIEDAIAEINRDRLPLTPR